MGVQLAGIDYLSPSQLSTFSSCERRWWHDRRGTKQEATEPLAMGGGLATALEHGNLSAGLREYELRRPQPDAFVDPELDKRAHRIATSIIEAAYFGYQARYPDPEGTVREETYLVDVDYVEGAGGNGSILQVRVDAIVPGLYLIEDKLRSGSAMQAAKLENEVRQGRQLTAEIYGHWKATGDLLPVKLRCTKKPDPRPLRNCPLEDIDVLVNAHFANDGVFVEYEAHRSEEQLAAFEEEFLSAFARTSELRDSATPVGLRNTEACFDFGRPCPALAYCQGDEKWGDE